MNAAKSKQLSAAQKANAEALVAMMRKTLDNIEKLANLNLSTIRSGIQVGADSAAVLLEAKTPKQALAIQTSFTEPSLERTREYYHNLYELLLCMQKDITDVMEEHYKSLTENAESAIEETKEKLPAGGDIFATTMKSVLQSSSQTFDRINFMAQQIAQIADNNIKAFTSLSLPAAKAKPKAKTAGSATAAASKATK